MGYCIYPDYGKDKDKVIRVFKLRLEACKNHRKIINNFFSNILRNKKRRTIYKNF